MSIRKKLLLSNFGMVLIPIVLFFVCIMLLYAVFMRDIRGIKEYYGDTEVGGRGLAYVHQQFEKKNVLISGIQFLTEYEPEKLSDSGFLNEMSRRLDELKAGLVVARGGTPTFVSSYVQGVDFAQLEASGESGHHGSEGRGGEIFFRAGDRDYSVVRYEGTFADGSRLAAYVLSDMSPMARLFPKIVPVAIVTLLLILVLTNGVLTLLVSRSFIRPLYALKDAAERIKDGDLDRGVQLSSRKDEFGELAEAFEEMRARLKRSIGLQLQYEENRKELLSSISHDLKTPITAIKGCVEGILDGIADTPEKRNKYMRMISKKAADMDRQIDELFLFSKLDLKRVPFHFEKLELVAYAEEHAEELRLQPQNADIEFTVEAGGLSGVYVRGDREKLHRVIQNVVDNSIKYLDKRPKRIGFELSVTPDEAILRIRDNGAGIGPEALPHIFDRFYRADPSRTGNGGGSGLGLAIVKQIVEEHDGRVWADSVPGEGTVIAIALPRAPQSGTGGEPG
ncbi:sensor histidine kinase [Paenibacillus sp. GYB003]|uniref:sensor histidine kinase n=1 Tax=Paenibacillus sp. GYB003 TaxID=2994392 RepID=UPI002F967E7B